MTKKAPPKKVAPKSVGPTEVQAPKTLADIKNKKDRAELEKLLDDRLTLKAAEAEIKTKLQENADEIEPLYAVHDVKTMAHNGKLIVRVESSGRDTLNKKMLWEGLIKRSVDIDIVEASMKEATSRSKGYTSFQVRDEKEGVGGDE
jgi:hypothetical protein